MTEGSKVIQPQDQGIEVLERELCTCDKHVIEYERRLERRAPRMVLGKPFSPPARWVGGCRECELERVEGERRQAGIEAQRVIDKKMQRQFGRAGIPFRLQNRSFENYSIENDGQGRAMIAALEFAEQFEKHAERGTVLIFAGRTGTGKGHLAAAVGMQIIRAGYSVLFSTAREIILMLRESWSNKDAPGEIKVLNRLVDVDLLVIDEIGVQFGTDGERDQLFSVIDGRYREQRPMILTTNLSPAGLKDVIGERSFSRLREDGQWIPFEWADWRGRHAIPSPNTTQHLAPTT